MTGQILNDDEAPNNMVERVARAIARAVVARSIRNVSELDLRSKVDILWQGHIEEARAAIAAMRDPTPRMLSANRMHDTGKPLDEWRSMIDEAMAEK
jgi:hypothetical protein